MKPFDIRLLRYARSIRGVLVAGGALALAQTLTTVGFAWFATAGVVAVADGRPRDLPVAIAGLAVVVIARAGVIWATGVNAARGAARVKAQLRDRGLAAARSLAGGLDDRSRARDTTVLTRGLDALDDYFGSSLPQLILSAVSTPVLIGVIAVADLPSAVAILPILPVIPVFMILIGLATQAVQRRQWEALEGLGRRFLDLVEGLATLRIFRRDREQLASIEDAGQDYRRRTMAVLRVTFLSGFVLELAGTLSVAIVAVLIGTRLVDGSLALAVGLFVLLLTPDVFLPIRQVGASFHAAAEGLEAADALFASIERAEGVQGVQGVQPATARVAGQRRAGDEEEARRDEPGLVFEDVRIERGGRVVVDGFDACFPAGLHVLRGPSGAGKSSLLAAVLGFVGYEGSIRVDGRPLSGPAGPSRPVAWAGQRPGLVAGTVAENVALGAAGAPEAPDAALIARALARVGLGDLDPERTLGAAGAGLSGGQAQRLAVARALYRFWAAPCRVLLLDEPSSALDGAAQETLAAGLRAVADAGASVVVVSHRDGFAEVADSVREVGSHVVA